MCGHRRKKAEKLMIVFLKNRCSLQIYITANQNYFNRKCILLMQVANDDKWIAISFLDDILLESKSRSFYDQKLTKIKMNMAKFWSLPIIQYNSLIYVTWFCLHLRHQDSNVSFWSFVDSCLIGNHTTSF